MGNGLLITDICQNSVKGRKNTSIPCRNMQTALRHQCQQTDGFQCHRFTAGIGAGNDHGVKIRAQPDGDGYNDLGINQRVSCLAQLYPALIVHNRRTCAHLVGQLRLGENYIQLHQHLIVQIDGFPIACGLCGQLRQNPLNFFLFLQFQLPQSVIGIHSGHGFHKIGGTGCRNIVHQTGNIVLAFAFYGNNIPPLPNGNDRLPQEFGIGW